MDNVLINKADTIERCIARVREEYIGFEDSLTTNFTKQDSIMLNLQRACETAIDMGTHMIRMQRFGVPQSSRDVFAMLAEHKIIPDELSHRLQAMVGFRNIAIHNYKAINLEIIRSIINNHLDDFLQFSQKLLRERVKIT